jgi:hypothetical protein
MSKRTIIDLTGELSEEEEEEENDSDFGEEDRTQKTLHAYLPVIQRSESSESFESSESSDDDDDRAQTVFERTFLGPLARAVRLSARPGQTIAVLFEEAKPYNYLNLQLTVDDRTVPVQLWQTSIEDVDTRDVAKFAMVIDLDGAHSSPPSIQDGVNTLKKMGWSNTTTLNETLSTMVAPKKAAVFLEKTFRVFADLLRDFAALATDATDALPAVMVLHCKRGLERSLVLFHVIAFGLALLRAARRRDATASELAREVGQTLAVRHRRVLRDGTEGVIDDPKSLIPLTLDAIPDVLRQSLVVKLNTTESPLKKARFEACSTCLY